MLADDYLMRSVKAIAAAIARMMGHVRRGEAAQARQVLEEAYSGQVGFSRAQLDGLDAATVVRTLGVERAEALVSLVLVEAEICRAEGRSDDATAREARALELDAVVRTQRKAREPA